VSKRKTHEEFLKELKMRQPELFSQIEIIGRYINMHTKIIVKTKYGNCSVKALSLYKGYLPSIKTSINRNEYFFNMLKEKNYVAFSELVFMEDITALNKKVVVIDKYGKCKISPSNLLVGKNTNIRSAIDKHNYFLNSLKDKNHKAYKELTFLEEYVGASIPMLAKSIKYGTCLVVPSNLLHGYLVDAKSIKDKHRYFIKKLKDKNIKMYNELYFYNNIEKMDDRIIAKHIYGDVYVVPSKLVSGTCCNISSAVDKNKYFINKAKEIHGDDYGYDKVKYVDSDISNVEIFCKIHNSYFSQLPCNHLNGSGCPKCAGENSGQSLENWIRSAERSKNFSLYKLYKIKCWNENEEFYKIGITFRTIESRFKGDYFPYKYEVIEVINSLDGKYIWDLEKSLHFIHKGKNLKYVPKLEFGGMGECFTKLID